MRIPRRVVLGVLGALPLACARRPARDDALELVVPNEPSTLDPRFTADVYGLRIARLCHATLVAPHPDTLAPEPWLASSIEDDEGGALVVTLREGARFHDGAPIAARDVVATFRALRDEALGSPSRRVVSELASIDALDGDSGRRIRFVPVRPRATLRTDLDVAILRADQAASPRESALVGSGPFRVASREPGSIALAPAATYFDPPPRPSPGRGVVVRTVRDEAARALRIVAGSVDVASNVLAPALALSLPARSDAPAGLHVARRPGAGTTFLTIHCGRVPRAEVRRAIAAAIDRRAIVDAKLGGAATLARGLLPETIELAPRRRPALAHDPAGARSALGPLGASGTRFTLATTPDRTRLGIARAIAQAISDAGVPTEVRVLEFGTFFARLAAGDFDLAPLVAPEIADPDVLRWYLHGDAIPPKAANRARFRDARVDALLDRGLATLDREKRRAIYEDLEAVLREEMPYVPLWHEDHVAVTSARAKAFQPSADGRWGALAKLG